MQQICDYLTEWCKKWRLVINCSKNKTEAIIVQPKGATTTAANIISLEISGNTINYVKKSKVLGLVVDENLTFRYHAIEKLQSCWYTWNNITRYSNRHKGLNVASLTMLLKALILTKILYASPIWLESNIDIFKNFWSRAVLRLSGSEYHPPRVVTELALQLPPLDIVNKINIVKFCLKCLASNDEMKSVMLQLEDSTSHPWYQHITYLRQYSAWKRKHSRSTRAISILLIDESIYHYTKIDMNKFLHHCWNIYMKTFLADSVPSHFICSENTMVKLLFNKQSSRYDDTSVIAV